MGINELRANSMVFSSLQVELLLVSDSVQSLWVVCTLLQIMAPEPVELASQHAILLTFLGSQILRALSISEFSFQKFISAIQCSSNLINLFSSSALAISI